MRGHQHTNLIDPIFNIESDANGAAIGAEGNFIILIEPAIHLSAKVSMGVCEQWIELSQKVFMGNDTDDRSIEMHFGGKPLVLRCGSMAQR